MYTWHSEKAVQCRSGQFDIPTRVSKLDDDAADDDNDNDNEVDVNVQCTH